MIWVVGAVVLTVLVSVGISLWVRSLTKGLGSPPTIDDLNRGLHFANVMNARQAERDDLRARGVPASVEVIEYQDTGTKWAMAPVYRLRVRIFKGPHVGSYVSIQEAVPFVRVSSLTEGAELNALVDPTDPNRLAIDW